MQRVVLRLVTQKVVLEWVIDTTCKEIPYCQGATGNVINYLHLRKAVSVHISVNKVRLMLGAKDLREKLLTIFHDCGMFVERADRMADKYAHLPLNCPVWV